MAAPGKQPKMMSTRLANMKFMQRGAPPSTPAAAEPPTKKMRLASGESKPADPSPDLNSRNDHEQWYLSFKPPRVAQESPLRIVSAGFSALDAKDTKREEVEEEESEEEEEKQQLGRKSFGKFNRKLEKSQNPDLPSSSSSSDEDSDSDEEEDGEIPSNPVDALIAQGQKDAAARIRAERKAKRKSDGAESARMAEQRRKKDVNLNRVAAEGDSPFGRQRGSPLNALSKVECYQCHGKGHLARDCPEKPQQQQQQRSRSRLSYD